MVSVKTIVIANIAEFNHRAMAKSFSQSEFIAWDEASVALADMALFWRGDDKVVILPYSPNEFLFLDMKIALGYKNVTVIRPRTTSHSICQDIIKDVDLFEYLVKIIRDSDWPQIISWGATTQFYLLLSELRRAGVKYVATEAPTNQIIGQLYISSQRRAFANSLQKSYVGFNYLKGLPAAIRKSR